MITMVCKNLGVVTKRLLNILLIIGMLFTLVSCGKDSSGSSSTETTITNPAPSGTYNSVGMLILDIPGIGCCGLENKDIAFKFKNDNKFEAKIVDYTYGDSKHDVISYELLEDEIFIQQDSGHPFGAHGRIEGDIISFCNDSVALILV